MKKIIIGVIFLVSFNIQAQIVVVRVDESGIVQPITDQDIQDHNQQIIETLLKYSWPTCIAHDLTDEEKVELLTSDKRGAELEFIRKKIKNISSQLDVIFVPTTLYELFLIKTINQLGLKTDSQKVNLLPILNQTKEDVAKKIKQKNLKISPVLYLKEKIKAEYNKFNDNLLKDFFGFKSLVFHKKLIEYLSSIFNLESISQADQVLYNNRHAVMEQILKSKETTSLSWIDDHDTLGIIKNGIDLDYKGFEKNQALLFRGSNFLNVSSLHGTKKIVATTVYGANYSMSDRVIIKKAQDISLYSQCFGNSLLAGYYNHIAACVYYYLNNIQDMGYALFIDKLAYVDNYISNLFLISALATELGLLGEGQWFYSRSKPVVLNKKDKLYSFLGTTDYGVLDPYGIFLIQRNPYRQAELFSEYLAKNGVIIHKGDYKDLTEEEKSGLEQLLKNQKEIGTEYKVIAWFKNLEHKLKERIFTKKQALMIQKKSDLKEQNNQPEKQQNVVEEKDTLTWWNWAKSWFK